jgi:hypothetical protein
MSVLRTKVMVLLSVLFLLIVGLIAGLSAGQASAAPPPPASGTVVMLQPSRIVDSRAWMQLGTFDAYQAQDIQVQGHGGIPAFPTQTAGVILNITVVPVQTWDLTPGYLTVWASNTPRPEVSQVSYGYWNVSTEVIVKPSDDGSLRIFNGGPGHVDVLVDVEGYIVA